MDDTVFSPSFGNRPSQLVGREAIVSDVMAGLDSAIGNRSRSTILLGQRGYGKTVLLWEFASRARQMGYAVANPTSVREGMVSRIAEKLWDDGERLSQTSLIPNITGGSAGALGFSFSFSIDKPSFASLSPEARIERLARDLTSKGIGTLILVDELQANNKEIRSLVSTYQELIGEGLNVAIVMAGLPSAVSGVLNDHVLTFLNRATKVALPPLSIGDIDAYYRNAFRSCGIDISPELRRKAATSTQGSPYLMQLVGHYIVKYSENNEIDSDSLDEALLSASYDYRDDVCKTTLASLSAGDIAYLRAMSQLNMPCRSSEVASLLGVTADYGQQYRRRLLDAGVIEAPATGSLIFAVPYLEDYLKML